MRSLVVGGFKNLRIERLNGRCPCIQVTLEVVAPIILHNLQDFSFQLFCYSHVGNLVISQSPEAPTSLI